MKKLNLGVIGISEGNGHPYSWAAIFNGFDHDEMSKCPFPVIPQYLSEEKYPEDFLVDLGEVTHVWSQDVEESNMIAKSAKIPHVVNKLEDMIGNVDAVLLARDDAENHLRMSKSFLQAGIPIFIDKPLAYSLKTAQDILSYQTYEGQLYTCSSLRYSTELLLSEEQIKTLGDVYFIEATVPKSWEKYAIHVIEPIIAGNPSRGNLLNVKVIYKREGLKKVLVEWENLTAVISAYGVFSSPIEIKYFGSNGQAQTNRFTSAFPSFKKSLETFVLNIGKNDLPIPRNETLEIINIIEKGING
ncbi:Gfo/Idh/MocA family oxidoreductase [Ulvibacter antarcticus]|uniref:Gfo/Idh/MocA-like oxidoreductase N-terminal domain-containing protein n=1 Tax=Ulvibacter antarcticus TaxID=442714 RepID=A0A3L9Z1J1_9FLAO|nr:Gfo/Idh/MocA family oxidoreductase [Ulvibacter antarcticus]RMA65990.1 hypothetical protein BXY75_0406 [Ulvibacter antarcticus]